MNMNTHKQVGYKITIETYNKLKAFARQNKIRPSEIVETAIKSYLAVQTDD